MNQSKMDVIGGVVSVLAFPPIMGYQMFKESMPEYSGAIEKKLKPVAVAGLLALVTAATNVTIDGLAGHALPFQGYEGTFADNTVKTMLYLTTPLASVVDLLK